MLIMLPDQDRAKLQRPAADFSLLARQHRAEDLQEGAWTCDCRCCEFARSRMVRTMAAGGSL